MNFESATHVAIEPFKVDLMLTWASKKIHWLVMAGGRTSVKR